MTNLQLCQQILVSLRANETKVGLMVTRFLFLAILNGLLIRSSHWLSVPTNSCASACINEADDPLQMWGSLLPTFWLVRNIFDPSVSCDKAG